MEEAYAELYQQFLSLRSLCLRQAALLHQLTTALQKQQGVPNGEVSEMTSVPVQRSCEISAYHHEWPQPRTETPAAQRGVERLPRNMGTFSDLLAEDMSKLCVEMPSRRTEEVKAEEKALFLFAFDPLTCHGASNDESPDHVDGGRTLCTVMTPLTDGCSAAGGLFSRSDEPLMSDVALQSHVCEFCQAVFPGDSTTGGEFLRHLYTHVT
ncbi:uncharacterized protein [Brachyistius frenatus]|uniref:uncharacterized protein n=1 Tax=Brachyistius frenatus TaxID=100188 RepID=UPI0037E9B0FA